MMKANEKRSFNTCFMDALNNFDRNDYCITCTFGKAISDADRVKLVKNMLTRLRRFYNKIGAVLRYQMFWGRGDENEELHVHILVNRIDSVTFEELLKVLRDKLGKIDVHLKELRKKWSSANNDYLIIKTTILYLYKHWSTLTEADSGMWGCTVQYRRANAPLPLAFGVDLDTPEAIYDYYIEYANKVIDERNQAMDADGNYLYDEISKVISIAEETDGLFLRVKYADDTEGSVDIPYPSN